MSGPDAHVDPEDKVVRVLFLNYPNRMRVGPEEANVYIHFKLRTSEAGSRGGLEQDAVVRNIVLCPDRAPSPPAGAKFVEIMLQRSSQRLKATNDESVKCFKSRTPRELPRSSATFKLEAQDRDRTAQLLQQHRCCWLATVHLNHARQYVVLGCVSGNSRSHEALSTIQGLSTCIIGWVRPTTGEEPIAGSTEWDLEVEENHRKPRVPCQRIGSAPPESTVHTSAIGSASRPRGKYACQWRNHNTPFRGPSQQPRLEKGSR
ncbi:hypothetical protein BDN67DRAFT_1047242 [Paxillus ammoniavirescens]|nr:hypothetical protein BDN67DRAFT_1047242 [Paxillus ammoniavirescens]